MDTHGSHTVEAWLGDLSITLLACEMMSPFTKFIKFIWCHPLPNLSKQILGGEQFVFSSLPLLIVPMSTSQSHLLFSNCALAVLIWTVFISHLDIWGNAQTALHIFVMWPYGSFSWEQRDIGTHTLDHL